MVRKSNEFAGTISSFIEQTHWKLTLTAIDTEKTFFLFPQHQLSTF